jgi:hypothetical protein
MAMKTLETLVLRAVPVACDVVSGQSIGSNGAMRPAAMLLSRHLMPRAMADAYPRGDKDRTEQSGATRVAPRAGRLARFAGVSGRRSPAINAGRAILSRWPNAKGEPQRPHGRRLAGFLSFPHAGLSDWKSRPQLCSRGKEMLTYPRSA